MPVNTLAPLSGELFEGDGAFNIFLSSGPFPFLAIDSVDRATLSREFGGLEMNPNIQKSSFVPIGDIVLMLEINFADFIHFYN